VYGLAWRNQDVDGREGRCNNLKIRFSEETLMKNKKELNYLLSNPKDFLKLMRDKFPQAVNDDINLYDTLSDTIQMNLDFNFQDLFLPHDHPKLVDAVRRSPNYDKKVRIAGPNDLRSLVAQYS